MSDAELSTLARTCAAGDRSVLPALERALAHAGILGEETRLPELGAWLRRAGLTADDGRKWGDPDVLQPCPTDAELPAFLPQWEGEPRGPGHEKWYPWQAPPLGASVEQVYYDYPDGNRSIFRGVVSGAVCGRLLLQDKHCSTCECRRLNTSLGLWIIDSYHARRDGNGDVVSPMYSFSSKAASREIMQETIQPCAYRRSSVVVPGDLLRPRLQGRQA